jgi:hypothetical protein
MPKRNSHPTILVLDSDLGFMLALSQELSRRQIAVIPSRSVREAQSLLAEFRLSLNLLLMHRRRPGACAFVGEMTKTHPPVKIVGIVSERHRCRKCAERLTGSLSRSGRPGPGTNRLLRESHRGAGEETRTRQSLRQWNLKAEGTERPGENGSVDNNHCEVTGVPMSVHL